MSSVDCKRNWIWSQTYHWFTLLTELTALATLTALTALTVLNTLTALATLTTLTRLTVHTAFTRLAALTTLTILTTLTTNDIYTGCHHIWDNWKMIRRKSWRLISTNWGNFWLPERIVRWTGRRVVRQIIIIIVSIFYCYYSHRSVVFLFMIIFIVGLLQN